MDFGYIQAHLFEDKAIDVTIPARDISTLKEKLLEYGLYFHVFDSGRITLNEEAKVPFFIRLYLTFRLCFGLGASNAALNLKGIADKRRLVGKNYLGGVSEADFKLKDKLHGMFVEHVAIATTPTILDRWENERQEREDRKKHFASRLRRLLRRNKG